MDSFVKVHIQPAYEGPQDGLSRMPTQERRRG